MDAAQPRVAFLDDGERQPAARRNAVDRRGGVPMDAMEKCLPHAMPVTAGFSDGRLARGKVRRLLHGTETRRVLQRLLLVFDGAFVRGGRVEYFVGGAGFRALAGGENGAQGVVAVQKNGGVSSCFRGGDDARGLCSPQSL